MMSIPHQQYLEAAIKEACQSLAQGGIPIGAVLVYQDKIIGRGHNQWVQKGSAILHGEMDAGGKNLTKKINYFSSRRIIIVHNLQIRC